MSASPPARRGLAWPVCTLLLVLGLGALVWHGYGKWREEQALRQARAVQQAAPPLRAAPQVPAASPQAPPSDTYRSLPAYFIAGFGIVMALILGAILYLWWSLKDLEGGKRYGEGGGEGPPSKE